MTDDDEEPMKYETDAESLAQYAEMAMNFLPTVFCLESMGDVFFRHLRAAGMNCEQASTALAKQVHKGLMATAMKDELTDHDLVKLVNAICTLLHMRRARIQLVAKDTTAMTPEMMAKLDEIMDAGLPIEEMHRRVAEFKKEHGL